MKKFFYELNYRYVDGNNENHYFLIGYFSSLKKVEKAIENIKFKPGFKDYNGVFEIDKFSVAFEEHVREKSGILLYELSHEYTDDCGYDNFIVFGLYATRNEAEIMKSKMLQQYPYKEIPEGFLIAECKIDVCGWTEGFTNW